MAEPFAAALKRYIRAGYRAPDAMKAVWHDVKVGRVERPRRPGRRYRRAVAALPGRPLLNPRRNPLTAAERARILRESDRSGAAAEAALGRGDTATGHFMHGRSHGLRRALALAPPVLFANPLTRSETAQVLRAARGAAHLAATEKPGSLARGFWTGKAERGFEFAAGPLGAPSRGRRLRAWRAADPLRRTRANPDPQARLVDAAAQIAMRAAAEYLRRHNLEADPAALAATLRAWLKIKLPEGLRDARQALEAGMGKVAEQTFAASMAQAGIEAAKEAGFPKGGRPNPRRRRGRRDPTPTAVTAAQALARRHGLRVPPAGDCVQLARGLELCRDAQGYYVLAVLPTRGVSAPTGSMCREPGRNPRLYQLLAGGRDLDLGRFPTYKRAAAHARAVQRKHGGEFVIRGRRGGARTEERYVGPRRNPVGRRLRVIASHAGLARFMAEVTGPVGSIPREIHTPYASGPTHAVWNWRGVPVIVAETRHKRYEVFRVEGPLGPVDNPQRPRRRRALTVPEQHQARIARQTLRMPAPMVGVMGGPAKREARRILRRLRANPTVVPAAELRPGDVVLPPAREVTLWMRRVLRERGLPDSALELTVVSVRAGRSDKRGPWLVVTTRQTEAWLAGRPGYPFVFKARPATPWPLVRSGARANPLTMAEARQLRRESRRAGGRGAVLLRAGDIRGGHFNYGRASGLSEAITATAPAETARLLRNPRRSRTRYCPERIEDPRRFDRRSFRTVMRHGHRVTVGCPRGQYDAGRRRCRVGTRAQRILHPAGEGRCPLGGRAHGNPARTVRTTTRSTTTRLTVRHNPRLVAAACALCRREPRAPMSPYCRWCLGRIYQRNAPRGGVVIYDRLVELRAVKGRRSHYPRQPFKHRFTSAAKVIGLPDGSVLLRGPRPLWKRVEV